MLATLSDDELANQITKQRERVKAFQDDYFELAWESASRWVRKELPEAGFLKLEPDAFSHRLGLVAVLDKTGLVLADWDSIGRMGKRFGAAYEALASDGFFADYSKCFGDQDHVSFFDLEEHTHLHAHKFEAKVLQQEI